MLHSIKYASLTGTDHITHCLHTQTLAIIKTLKLNVHLLHFSFILKTLGKKRLPYLIDISREEILVNCISKGYFIL